MGRKRKAQDTTAASQNATAATSKKKGKQTKKTKVEVVVNVEVDPECQEKCGSAHVLCEDGVVWDAMLNQTNIQYNNNKFFKLQILEDDDGGSYSVWFHWGRVGKKGQMKLHPCSDDIDQAKSLFEKKFLEKTKNSWEERDSFEKVDGKYDLVKIDHEVGAQIIEERRKKFVPVSSKLDAAVQTLMELIFNKKAMEDALTGMQYDIKRAPLGNLTHQQVLAGYSALKVIEGLVMKKQTTGEKILQACNDFYTRIPHYFGMKCPPLITTLPEIKDKLQLLDVLGDIQAAMAILGEEPIDSRNPIDMHYESLHCQLSPLDDKSLDYKVIENYLRCSHAESHGMYKMKLEGIFECQRDGEIKKFKDVGNKMLLWHGSRISNYAGILSQGLRIAPPEAPVTGYMFGKGIYFADMASKSANYCYTTRSNNIGLLLLSEVSLGQQEKLLAANYDADKLPKRKHSVMGLGQIALDSSKQETLSDGTVIPMGKESETGVNNPNGYTLRYNEYIVYNPDQVRLRYLLKIKFIHSF